MVQLFGREIARRDLAERTGALAQLAGVELLHHADGPERGVRLLELRNGALAARIAVDRGFDILSVEHRGVPIGWRSPTGPRHPGLYVAGDDGGLGFLRSFTGLLATCGLDHALAPAGADADWAIYPLKQSTDYPLHGRVSQTPARLVAYGERWERDRCVLFAEGLVEQAAVFGEVLVLRRRVESELGGSAITVHDRVENRGFRPTPHMLLYHWNFGFPLLDEGAEFLAPIRAVVHTTHELRAQGVGYRRQGPPRADFVEQVYQHELAADADGRGLAALINDRLGLAAALSWDRAALPCLVQWQCLQSGLYVLGIEPSTNHVLGRPFAMERGELQVLQPEETRDYHLRLELLEGAEAIAGLRRRIEALHAPPPDFTPLSSEFPPLR